MQFKKGMISVVLFRLVCVGLPAPLFHFFVYIYDLLGTNEKEKIVITVRVQKITKLS